MELLDTITKLSREFGTDDYVKGGGGNTSVKDEKTLWVKPSGTTLKGMTPKTFVALSREKISVIYGVETPAESSAREELVKNIMADALLPESSGRASVEAPLHNIFDYRYVVHTHPAFVNGMCCAKEAKEVCNRLFPEALWMDYIDPGYTLCMETKKAIEAYDAENGKQPNMIFMKNHGVFVAADTEEEIRDLYKKIMSSLEAEFDKAGIRKNLRKSQTANAEAKNQTEAAIKEIMGKDGSFVVSSNWFKVANDALTPDHIVYMKSYPMFGEVSEESIKNFIEEKGYPPKVIVTDNAVFGVADTEKNANLALILAEDGALVIQLANAFGGVEFMTKRAIEFIDNWEVEAYRRKQVK